MASYTIPGYQRVRGGIVEIESSIIFKRLGDSYLLSLGYFRTLIMLDQCHDFCETGSRNKWISGRTSPAAPAPQRFTKEDIINSIMKTYKEDMDFIKTNFGSSEPQNLLQFGKLKDLITNNGVVRQHLTSTHGIRDEILKGGLEQNMGITSANLYEYVKQFNCSDFSKYLISILSSGQSNTGEAILGVDATKNNAGYSAVFTNMCDIINSPHVPYIAVLKSPATDYDAAGTSGVSNFIVNMIEKTDKKATVLGQSNPGVNLDYTIQVTVNKKPIIDFTYKVINEPSGDNYISCTINSFFSQGKNEPWRQKPNGTTIFINSKKIQWGPRVWVPQNSVAYLTENFSPDDNIYLFKTIGDLGQALSFKIESQKYPNATNFYLTFDYLSGLISSLFNPGTLLEDTGNAISPLTIFTLKPDELLLIKALGASVPDIAAAQQLQAMMRMGSVNKFGRKTNKISNMSNEELKTKLKSVGINVTKLNSKGKRLPLARKEMEKKALMFKNLQLRAKKYNIKLKYESKRRGYVYKGFQRLLNEIQRKLKK